MMTRNRWFMYTSQLNIELLLPLACLVAMVFHGLLLTFAGDFFSGSNVLADTSTGYLFTDSFSATLTRYDALNNMYLDDLSFATPGLANTNILGDSSTQMVPQGICKAGEYILISAYNSSSSKWVKQKGHSLQNSVIYILSEKGEYLNTLVLPDINHVGGLTFDGSNVWVAKSSNKTCSIIPYETIQMVAEGNEKSISLGDYLADVICNRSASFVEYHDGKLWVGTFAKKGKEYSEVGIYDIDCGLDGFSLNEVSTLRLPVEAQGISFYNVEGDEYMIVSTSYGRINNSTYYMYKVDAVGDKYFTDYRGKCELPPMSEEMYNDGQYSYLLFESAATLYSKMPIFHCKDPVDRICVVENSSLISMMQ